VQTDNPSLGILCALGAAFVFSIVNLEAKLLAETYSVAQVVFFRTSFALLPTFWILHRAGPAHLRPRRPWGHAGRAVAGLSSLYLSFLSFHLMPLAEAAALVQSAPLFVTMLSVPLLGERVGMHRKAAVVAGFLGVLMIVQPGTDVANWGAVAAVASAFTYGLAIIYMRELTRHESAATVAFWYTVFCAAAMALVVPFGWRTPGLLDLGMLVSLGLLGGLAQYLMSKSYSHAPAVAIAPLTFTGVTFAALFGLLVFGHLPNGLAWAGIGVVAASILYIAWRELVRTRAALSASPAAPSGAPPPRV